MLSEGHPAVDRHADLQLSSVDVFQENHGAVELAASLDVAAGVNKIMPCILQLQHMGVSENRLVPLNPMVLLIIIPIKWLFHWEYTLFLDKPILDLLPDIGNSRGSAAQTKFSGTNNMLD